MATAPTYENCGEVPARLDAQQAQGILSIHSSCALEECARSRAALHYLSEQPTTFAPTEGTTMATQPISADLDTLLNMAGEIAAAGGRTEVGVQHVLLALLRNPELVVEPVREIGIELATYGDRLARLASASQQV